jgi:hypothetical protein
MIRIDRLILDIPGMNPTRAAELAERIGTTLANVRTADIAIDRLEVVLPPGRVSDRQILSAFIDAFAARVA